MDVTLSTVGLTKAKLVCLCVSSYKYSDCELSFSLDLINQNYGKRRDKRKMNIRHGHNNLRITTPHSVALNSFPYLQLNLQKRWGGGFTKSVSNCSAKSTKHSPARPQQCNGRSPQLNSSCSLTRQQKPETCCRSMSQLLIDPQLSR